MCRRTRRDTCTILSRHSNSSIVRTSHLTTPLRIAKSTPQSRSLLRTFHISGQRDIFSQTAFACHMKAFYSPCALIGRIGINIEHSSAREGISPSRIERRYCALSRPAKVANTLTCCRRVCLPCNWTILTVASRNVVQGNAGKLQRTRKLGNSSMRLFCTAFALSECPPYSACIQQHRAAAGVAI